MALGTVEGPSWQVLSVKALFILPPTYEFLLTYNSQIASINTSMPPKASAPNNHH